MKIKICGLTNSVNIKEVATLNPDFMGFIFYKQSKRYVGDLSPLSLGAIPKNILKVGVFVNASLDEIREINDTYKFDFIQLHGDESFDFCEFLAHKGLQIIKAFGVDEKFDFTTVRAFEKVCKYFLFDTKTSLFGGSGKQFNWNQLENYKGSIPFILSGGIGEEDLEAIFAMKSLNDKIFGVDLNSRFESSAGVKDCSQLSPFIKSLRE